MTRSSSSCTWLAVAASVAAASWGLWAWFDVAPDATTRLRDDAYYEFVWAANVAAGRGPTVSDGVTTSGVQWLWSVLLVPFGVAGAALAPWLGFLLHVATAWIWLRVPRDRVTGICLSLCWLGHPLLLREAQNGQETALATFFACLLVAQRRAPESRFVALSVLAVLARSDLFGLVLALSIARHRAAWWRALPSPALAFAVPAIPNLLYGGGLLPDSGMPMAWLWHENLTASQGFWPTQWWFTRPVLLGGPFALASVFGYGLVAFLLLRPYWPLALRVVPAALVGIAHAFGGHDLAVAGICALMLLLLPAAGRRRPDPDLLAVAVGLAAIVVLHWAVRWYPRDYYLAPLVVAPFFALQRRGRMRILLLAFAVVQIQDGWRVTEEPLGGQATMALAGRELHRVLPPGERVGCFNSGLVTWFADVKAPSEERRRVVNLDGVVDHRSFRALAAHRLGDWLDREGIRFVLDAAHQFALDPAVPHASGRFFGEGFDPERDLVECARFVSLDAPAGSPPMRLYWRRGRGQPPLPGPPGLASSRSLLWRARAGESLVLVCGDVREELHAVDVATTVVLAPDPRRRKPDARLVVERR